MKQREIKVNPYIPPQWCKLSPMEHFDGMGGCWSVSSGMVQDEGFKRCETCEYVIKDYMKGLPNG